jgi:Tfp pilus assembly protein PilO
MKVIKKYRTLWVILAFLLLIDVAGYYFILEPQRRELRDLKKALHNKNNEKRVEKRDVSILSDSQRQAARSSQQIKEFNKTLPNKSEFVNILDEIFLFIDMENMTLRRVTYLPKQIRGTSLLDYSANFTITGDYGSVKGLLNKIEYSEHLFILKNLHLERVPENRSIDLTFTLSIILQSNKGLM